MPVLAANLRKQLEKAVTNARAVAEEAANAALVSLDVGSKDARPGMPEDQRKLRVRLRNHGRQLGDSRESNGVQGTLHLMREVAYQHWHRMLFGRFLAENSLLMHPEHGVALSINDCRNLAEEEHRDVWEMVGSFAQRCLPQIFRQDDPGLALQLAPEHVRELESVLADLAPEVFTADDSLGWVYQFWQADEKDRVNKSEVAIGANELPAVTQLFTEHYMVQFLLHNTLGAWHAAKVLAANPELAKTAQSEQELRDAVALGGGSQPAPNPQPLTPKPGRYTWDYLRFVREGENGPWRPAAGPFAEWPRQARDLKTLDPCCGSGHFLVELFTILLALREQDEQHRPRLDLIREVLRHNVHGLELDPRCTQIAAFALALAAWKAAGTVLPDLHVNVACSGISVGDDREAWLKLAGKDRAARETMDALFDLFRQAPLLGSLIDPARTTGEFFGKGFSAVRELVEKAVKTTADDEQREAGIAAVHVAEAVNILTDRYHLVVTNVPYLGRGKQTLELKEYCDTHHAAAKADLATCFVERGLRWCAPGGTTALVTPQNWLFLAGYRKLREWLFKDACWNAVARLGPGAFETISGHVVNVALTAISASAPAKQHALAGIDASPMDVPDAKAQLLRGGTSEGNVMALNQKTQLNNPSSMLMLHGAGNLSRLGDFADCYLGICTGDYAQFGREFWELGQDSDGWGFQRTTTPANIHYGGMSSILLWEGGKGRLYRSVEERLGEGRSGTWLRGHLAWGRQGIAIKQMGDLPAALYSGEFYDNNVAVLIPKKAALLPAIWAFCSSSDFSESVRAFNQAMAVDTQYLLAAPFLPDEWGQTVQEEYPSGLPEPQTNDPTQWLFHGHPAGMVAAGSASKSPFGVADTEGADRHPSLICREANPADVLQAAVARLLGYRWPAELDTEMRLDQAQRAWVERCAQLADHAVNDGILCFDRIRRPDTAADLLFKLLRAAFGPLWKDSMVRDLLKAASSKETSLDGWLRKDFFEQHLKLFHNRPFIWHIWDGLPDGFHALVNYHKLAGPDGEGRRTLESLTFSYLHDWIERQRAAEKKGEDGADERLACALELQQELKNIIEGEPYYDIFVRWKPLHKQPIGWEPDINDGVRMNIRPFMLAEPRRGKAGAGILRAKPNIKWTKDRGKEPQRPKADYPWFWSWDEETDDFMGDKSFDGNRHNDLHYSIEVKQAARARQDRSSTSRQEGKA